MTDGYGIPLGRVLAGATRHDSPLLVPTLDRLDDLGPLPDDVTVHLDAGYDSDKTRTLLDDGPPSAPAPSRVREKRSAGAGSIRSLHRPPRPRLLIRGASQWSVGRASPARRQDPAGNLAP